MQRLTEVWPIVPVADPLVNEALAGGLHPGELCSYFAADAALARRAAAQTMSGYVREHEGVVLHLAFNPLASAAAAAVPARLRVPRQGPVFTVRAAGSMERVTDLVEDHLERYEDTGLIVLDSYLSIPADRPYAPAAEQEAQVSRDVKSLARLAERPVLLVAEASLDPRDGRLLPSDFLYRDADALVRVNRGGYLTLIKNRNGEAHLKD